MTVKELEARYWELQEILFPNDGKKHFSASIDFKNPADGKVLEREMWSIEKKLRDAWWKDHKSVGWKLAQCFEDMYETVNCWDYE